jgi:hypothetical protein
MTVNASACQACPLNTYSESNGATMCTSCPPGYVSGAVASSSVDDCVNPIVNFSFGILSLLLSFLAVFVYIILGRVQRIGFERRRWLIEKCVSLYGIFLILVEEVRSICRVMMHLRATNLRNVEPQNLFSGWININNCIAAQAKKAVKYITFLLMVAILAVGTVLGSQHCMFCLTECYYIGLTEALELIRQIPRFSIESINFYSALVSFCI